MAKKVGTLAAFPNVIGVYVALLLARITRKFLVEPLISKLNLDG